MKKVLTILTIITIAFASCTKAKKLSKRVAAKWNIASKDVKFNFNNFPSTNQTYLSTGKGSIELKSDGTGTITDPQNAAGDLATYTVTDWYNDDLHITIMYKDQALEIHQVTFDVTSNEKEAQTWYNEMNEQQIAGKVNVKTTYMLTLAK